MFLSSMIYDISDNLGILLGSKYSWQLLGYSLFSQVKTTDKASKLTCADILREVLFCNFIFRNAIKTGLSKNMYERRMVSKLQYTQCKLKV